jgi:hypothetical protein
LWSTHFVAVVCTITLKHFLDYNVYEPSDRQERENYFQALTTMTLPEQITILVGGDFNYSHHPEYDRPN